MTRNFNRLLWPFLCLCVVACAGQVDDILLGDDGDPGRVDDDGDGDGGDGGDGGEGGDDFDFERPDPEEPTCSVDERTDRTYEIRLAGVIDVDCNNENLQLSGGFTGRAIFRTDGQLDGGSPGVAWPLLSEAELTADDGTWSLTWPTADLDRFGFSLDAGEPAAMHMGLRVHEGGPRGDVTLVATLNALANDCSGECGYVGLSSNGWGCNLGDVTATTVELRDESDLYCPDVSPLGNGAELAGSPAAIPGTPSGSANGHWIGFSFTPVEEVVVTHLGSLHLGMTSEVEVGLFEGDTRIASVFVQPTDPISGSYRYAGIEQVTLDAGSTYSVIGTFSAGGPFTSANSFAYSNDANTYNPLIQYVGLQTGNIGGPQELPLALPNTPNQWIDVYAGANLLLLPTDAPQ